MKKYVTIKDLARELKISTSTVSRALADSWDVNPQTRLKVLQMAQKMNYRPNLMAKNLQHSSTGIIGVVIPEFINSFFPNVIMGIQDVLYAENYRLLITQSNESSATELINLRMLEESMVDGIIMSISREAGNSEEYQRIINSGIPMAFFNRVCDQTDAPKVVINDRLMASIAVEHLIEMGHKRIMHLTGPKKLQLTNDRLAGYMDALERHGIAFDEDLIVEAGVLMTRGEGAMQGVLDSGSALPDAVFAFNDRIAIGAMTAMKRAGIEVGRQVALVGFSEDVLATIVEPQLTSVLQPTYQMGQEVARLLIEQIRTKGEAPNRVISMDAMLNVRASSKPE